MKSDRAHGLRVAAVVASLFAGAAPGVASAQTSGQGATADALFEDGTAALDRGDFAQACPKLAESYRLDPATGSVLALAVCYERAGKIASAWGSYRDAAERAHADGDADRERAARERVAGLAPRVPHARIVLGPGVTSMAGLEVRIDGVVVATDALAQPRAVDPGPHELEVRATSREPERRTWKADEGRTTDVTVDALREAASSTSPPGATDGETSGAQVAGLVMGGAGVVAVGLGVVFGVVALGDASDLEGLGYDSERSTCPPAALPECSTTYDAANRDGVLSTVFLVAGGALVAGGLTLWIVGGSESEATTALAVRPAPGGLFANGHF